MVLYSCCPLKFAALDTDLGNISVFIRILTTTRVLHNWFKLYFYDSETCRALVKKVRASLELIELSNDKSQKHDHIIVSRAQN